MAIENLRTGVPGYVPRWVQSPVVPVVTVGSLPMNSGVYKTLEYDKILKVLASFTSTPFGVDRAQSLSPSSDLEAIRVSLKETSEACQLLQEGKEIPLSETPDVRSHIGILQVERGALGAASLLELATVARVAARVKSVFGSRATELALLSGAARQIPDLGSLRAVIEQAIDRETTSVKDNASPELRSLRARLFKLRNRIRGILESYLRQKDSRKILQERIITERNGRAVLPVRSECRGQLVGIVHGTSASGATLFIEPLSTVEINNDVVSLEEEERQEVGKILLALTDEARSLVPELSRTVEIFTHLDLIQAKAYLSEAYQGAQPQTVEEKSLCLVDARHPLLIAKIADRAGHALPFREAVPISFRATSERSVLVFTGPNTGGKTVALKTAGLLSLMVQAGLHVPAAPESSFPVFKKVFADIGDEQSIGSSLSTFSAHLRNIVEMERDLEEPSLVILDEVGSGTDPDEGGALGTALVEHFRSRDALVLASTHHGMLKAYATTTPGVGCASFEFDPVTYEPIYELVEGQTGRSLAFEIALRLGLPEKVVAQARELQGEKERQVKDMLEQLEADTRELARDRVKLADERRSLEDAIHQQEEMEHEYVRSKEKQLQSLQDEIRAETTQARAELKEILEEVRARALAESQQSRSSLAQMETDAVKQFDYVAAKRLVSSENASPRSVLQACVGQRVTIPSLGLTGVVVETLGNDDVEVMVRDKKLRIAVTDLEAAAPVEPGKDGPEIESSSVHTHLPKPKHVPHELNVIGCTVDEAISQADKFLDDAFLSEHRSVRLIHGLGKGRLKNAIREWLETHPHVSGHQSERSGAVTVVELKN